MDPDGDVMIQTVRETMAQMFRDNTTTLVDESCQKPLPELQAWIRQGLIEHGTNVEQNDNDPLGDGDQSPIRNCSESKKQFYRDLFAMGT